MARRKRRRRRRKLGEVSIARACPREGLRVEFNPSAASHVLYRDYPNLPKRGERGTVTSISLGHRRATCMRGPGGGLVYVDWDGGGTAGVSSFDIDRVKR
jgi:hypothetical protein